MRILMLSSVFPLPANTGGLIRIYQVLKGLARYHEITFVSPIRDIQTQLAQELKKDVCTEVITVPIPKKISLDKILATVSPLPYHVHWFRCEPLKRLVNSLLDTQSFDLIYVHFLRTMQYLPQDVDIPVVLDQHNVDRDVWALRADRDPNWLGRTLSKLNCWKTIRYENRWMKHISAYVSVSELDCERTRAYAASRERLFFSAPNGVDLDFYASRTPDITTISMNIRTVAYMGAMDAPANIDAVLYLYHDVLPLINGIGKRLKLLVIGRNPPSVIRALENQSGNPGVQTEVTGTVEDVRPFLSQADVFVAPVLYGGGTKLKVLQAMAMKIPVVATPHAAQGLGAEDGTHLLIGNSAKEMAEGIKMLLCDDSFGKTLAQNSRDLVKKRFSWDSITQKLSGDIERIINE